MESRSPLFQTDRIKKPLLIVHGANDSKIKKSELGEKFGKFYGSNILHFVDTLDRLIAILRRNKVPVRYIGMSSLTVIRQALGMPSALHSFVKVKRKYKKKLINFEKLQKLTKKIFFKI